MYPDPILITGAGRRIGLHLAQRLLDEGVSVIIHYHRDSEEVEALRQRGVVTISGALDNAEGALSLAESVRSVTKRLRAVIHNASLFAPSLREPHAAAEQYQRFFAIHMLAPYLLNLELTPLLEASRIQPADIVHITDIFTEHPLPEFDLYCSSKAGLESLSQSLAMRLAPIIKVNCIRPGPILFQPDYTPEVRQRILAETPLGREGGPEAIYLALRAVLDNDYMTGAAIPVDGGRHLAR